MEFRALIFVAFLFSAAGFSAVNGIARADDDGLVVSGEPSFGQPTEIFRPVSESYQPPSEVGEWVPPPGYDFPTKKAALPRITLEETQRLRKYVNSLCELDPVAREISNHVRVEGKRRVVSVAQNKQGSLQLLLENYVSALRLEAACTAKPAGSCRDPGRTWEGSHAAFQAWSHSRKDLLASQKMQTEALRKALSADFYELRDAAQLSGKPEGLATAERLLSLLKSESSCRTRAVRTFTLARR